MIRTHAVSTPEPCQGRKAAAIRDAWHRRDIRILAIRTTSLQGSLLRVFISLLMLNEGIRGGIQKFLIFNCLFFGLIGGCAKDGDRSTSKTTLTISAAASMQNVLEDIRVLYNQKYPKAKITLNFGSSGSLQHQIEQGAPVDIFVSAAPQQMNRLAERKLLRSNTRRDLVKNQMVLVVSKDESAIANFDDLREESALIALGEPDSVPAGNYAREILTNLDIIDTVKQKAVYGKDVRQVVTYVATGNTDAGIVYHTDTVNNQRIKVVAIAPETIHSPVVYPVAITKESKNLQAAMQMLEFLFSREAQAVFEQHGFMPVESKVIRRSGNL